jgi:protein TonB
MEIKKTPEADLENERITFFLLGFTVVLATLFVLLEWRSEAALSLDWEGFSALYIEQEYNEPASASEFQDQTTLPQEPEIKEEQAPVAYEDFNVVEEVPDTEKTVADLFHETNAEEPDSEKSPEKELSKEALSEMIYTEAEVMPQYPGGYTELNRYLFNHLKYPASASSQRIQGRVWCSFIINKDGSVSDIQLERGVYISLDQESLRVLRSMRAWIPGTIRGEPVRVKVYLPLVFKL